MKKNKILLFSTIVPLFLIFLIELIIYLHIFKAKDLLNILPVLYVIAAIAIVSFCFYIYDLFCEANKKNGYNKTMLFVCVLSIVPVIFIVNPNLVPLPDFITNILSAGHFWLIVLAACQLCIIIPALYQLNLSMRTCNKFFKLNFAKKYSCKSRTALTFIYIEMLFLVLSFDITLLQFSHINKLDSFSQAIKHKVTLSLVSGIAILLFGKTIREYFVNVSKSQEKVRSGSLSRSPSFSQESDVSSSSENSFDGSGFDILNITSSSIF